MQSQQALGNLCHLTTLTVLGPEADTNPYCFLSGAVLGAVLMLAGAWPLQDVEICGDFDFDMAVVLLPPSLKLCEAMHNRVTSS